MHQFHETILHFRYYPFNLDLFMAFIPKIGGNLISFILSRFQGQMNVFSETVGGTGSFKFVDLGEEVQKVVSLVGKGFL